MSGQSAGRVGSPRGIGPAVLIWLGAAIYVPGILLAGHPGGMNRAYRLILYTIVAVCVLALVSLAGARASGRSAWRWLAGVSFLWLVLSQPGTLSKVLGLSMEAVVGMAGIGSVLIGFLWHLGAVRVLSGVIGFVMATTPIADYARMMVSTPSSDFARNNALLPAEARVDPLPDVWLLILDGYPSDAARTLHGVGRSPISTAIRRNGGETNGNALSPYAVTRLSIPAILEGVPPLRGDVTHPVDGSEVRRVIGGDNFLVRSLAGVGYHSTIVENGWHLTACSHTVDNCVPAPLLDDQLAVALSRSVLGGVLGIRHDSSVPTGVEHLASWLEGNAKRLSNNGVSDFVQLHFISPHPPFLFDAACERTAFEIETDTGGLIDPYWRPDQLRGRQLRYQAQLACIDSIVVGLIDQVGADAIVAVTGDHGPASSNQLVTDPRDWSLEMLRERYLTMAGVILPSPCASSLDSTMMVAPAIVECLTGVTTNVEVAAFLNILPRSRRGFEQIARLDGERIAEIVDVP